MFHLTATSSVSATSGPPLSLPPLPPTDELIQPDGTIHPDAAQIEMELRRQVVHLDWSSLTKRIPEEVQRLLANIRIQAASPHAPLEVGGSTVSYWIGNALMSWVIDALGAPSHLVQAFKQWKPGVEPDLDLSLYCPLNTREQLSALSEKICKEGTERRTLLAQAGGPIWLSVNHKTVDLVLWNQRTRDHLWLSDALKILIYPDGQVKLSGQLLLWTISNLEKVIMADHPETIFDGLRRLLEKEAKGWRPMPGLKERLAADAGTPGYFERLIATAPVDREHPLLCRFLELACDFVQPKGHQQFKQRVFKRVSFEGIKAHVIRDLLNTTTELGLVLARLGQERPGRSEILTPRAIAHLWDQPNEAVWEQLTGQREFSLTPLLHLAKLLRQLAKIRRWRGPLKECLSLEQPAIALMRLSCVQKSLNLDRWRFRLLELAVVEECWISIAKQILGQDLDVKAAYYQEIPPDYPIDKVEALLLSEETPEDTKVQLLKQRTPELSPAVDKVWQQSIRLSKDMELWAMWVEWVQSVPECAYALMPKDSPPSPRCSKALRRVLTERLEHSYPSHGQLTRLTPEDRNLLRPILAKGCGERTGFFRKASVFLLTYGWDVDLLPKMSKYLRWAAKKPNVRGQAALELCHEFIDDIPHELLLPLIALKDLPLYWDRFTPQEQATLFHRFECPMEYWSISLLDHLGDGEKQQVIETVAPQIGAQVCSIFPHKSDPRWLIGQVRKLKEKALPSADEWLPCLQIAPNLLSVMSQLYPTRWLVPLQILAKNPLKPTPERWNQLLSAHCHKVLDNQSTSLRKVCNQIADLQGLNAKAVLALLLIVKDQRRRQRLWQQLLDFDTIDTKDLHLYLDKATHHLNKSQLKQDITILRSSEIHSYRKGEFLSSLSTLGLICFCLKTPDEPAGDTDDLDAMEAAAVKALTQPTCSEADILGAVGKFMPHMGPNALKELSSLLADMDAALAASGDPLTALATSQKARLEKSCSDEMFEHFSVPLEEGLDLQLEHLDAHQPNKRKGEFGRGANRMQQLGQQAVYEIVQNWLTVVQLLLMSGHRKLFTHLMSKVITLIEGQKSRESALLLGEIALERVLENKLMLIGGDPALPYFCNICEHLLQPYHKPDPVSKLEQQIIRDIVIFYKSAHKLTEAKSADREARWQRFWHPLVKYHSEWLPTEAELKHHDLFA